MTPQERVAQMAGRWPDVFEQLGPWALEIERAIAEAEDEARFQGMMAVLEATRETLAEFNQANQAGQADKDGHVFLWEKHNAGQADKADQPHVREAPGDGTSGVL